MLKRILLAFGAVFVILVAVLVVRTLQVPAPAPAAEASQETVMDKDAAAARLAQAVQFQTISYQSGAAIDTAVFRGFHNFLATTFPNAHAAMTREVVGGLSLLYTWRGTDTTLAPVVLMGHMDVVPVTTENRAEWEKEPFGGAIADGFVWGRGTLDDKVTVLAIFEAVEAMAAAGMRPSRTVYLTFGHDEEVGGMYGARVMVDTLVARGVKPALVLDEGGFLTSGAIPGIDGRAAVVGIAEKGYLSLTLTARAVGGHSSMPPERTAVGALSAAIEELIENPFEASLDGPSREMVTAMAPYVGFGQRLVLANLWLTEPVVTALLTGSPTSAAMVRTTTAPTMLAAGVKDNVLPPEATAVVNFRILPGETRASVIARVTEIVDDTLIAIAPRDSATADPSPVSRTDGEAFALIARTIRAMAPGEQVPVLPYLVMGGTDAKFWGKHSDRVYRFLAVPLGDNDRSRVHGVNERITVDGYASAVTFYARLLRQLDGL